MLNIFTAILLWAGLINGGFFSIEKIPPCYREVVIAQIEDFEAKRTPDDQPKKAFRQSASRRGRD